MWLGNLCLNAEYIVFFILCNVVCVIQGNLTKIVCLIKEYLTYDYFLGLILISLIYLFLYKSNS